MLAALLNIPSGPEGWSYFGFHNMDEHRQILAGLRRQGTSLPEYVLDPIPLHDIGAWAYNHQAMHTGMNEALGIAGSDLTTVNFNDPGEVSSWIRLHFNEHALAAQKLGIG